MPSSTSPLATCMPPNTASAQAARLRSPRDSPSSCASEACLMALSYSPRYAAHIAAAMAAAPALDRAGRLPECGAVHSSASRSPLRSRRVRSGCGTVANRFERRVRGLRRHGGAHRQGDVPRSLHVDGRARTQPAQETRARPGRASIRRQQSTLGIGGASGRPPGSALQQPRCRLPSNIQSALSSVSPTGLGGIALGGRNACALNAPRAASVLPDFAVQALCQRRESTRASSRDAVIPTRKGTCQHVNNVERRCRQIRQDTGLEWVTPHTFRRTVATLISEPVNSETASQQLGHSSPTITREFYIAKPAIAADVAHVL